MDKFEYNLKIDQIKSLCAKGDYESAAEMADTINWNKIRNANALVKAGEVYEKAGRYSDAREVLLMAYEKSPIGRMIIYHLAELSVQMKDYNAAQEYYDEFLEIAPHDNARFGLHYKIRKGQGAKLPELISILEEYREEDYSSDEYAYELACLYEQAGEIEKCVDACNQLVLWFTEGDYVERAMELKMKYRPLNKAQQERYRSIRKLQDGYTDIDEDAMSKSGEYAHEAVSIPKVEVAPEKFNTMDLQKEVALGIQQIMNATEEVTVNSTIENLKHIVEDVPNMKIPSEPVKPKAAIIQPKANNGAAGYRNLIGEESDGQMSLITGEHKVSEKQITGQISIQDLLNDWEKTLRKTEADLEAEEKKSLEDAKSIALQQAESIMGQLTGKMPAIVSDEEDVDEPTAETGVSVEDAPEKPAVKEKAAVEVTAEKPAVKEKAAAEVTAEKPAVKEKAAAEVTAEKPAVKAELLAEDAAFHKVEESLKEDLEAEELETALEKHVIIEAVKKVPAEMKIPEIRPEPEELPELDLALVSQLASKQNSMVESSAGPAKVSAEPATMMTAEVPPIVIPKPITSSGKLPIKETQVFSGTMAAADSTIVKEAPTKVIPQSNKKIVQDEFDIDKLFNGSAMRTAEKKIEEEIKVEQQNMTIEIPRSIDELTDEMKSAFSYFVPIRGMEDQLCDAINEVTNKLVYPQRIAGGNLIIMGEPGCGKTVLATSFIKVMQDHCGRPTGKIGKIDANALIRKDIQQLFRKVAGGCLIIESAGSLDRNSAISLSYLIECDTTGTLVILEDTTSGIKKALSLDDSFSRKFTAKINVPIFTNDELVAFARSYARELGYKIDDMAILALHKRISNIQRIDQATTLAEVKEIVDEAVERESHFGFNKYLSLLTGRRYTNDDRILLTERQFTK